MLREAEVFTLSGEGVHFDRNMQFFILELLMAANAWFSRVPKARRVSEANELQPFVSCSI